MVVRGQAVEFPSRILLATDGSEEANLAASMRGRMEHGATADGLPTLNRRTLQKAREWAYLQRLRENLTDFPEGEVLPSEHPDFLIKAQPRWIGIEIT